MNKRLFITACIFGFSTFIFLYQNSTTNNSGTTSTTTAFDGYDIILIAGQSNAAGAGCCITELDLVTKPSLVQLGRGSDDLKVIPAKEPLHSRNLVQALEKQTSGFGLVFSRLYSRDILAANRKALIINTALGGSSFLGAQSWKGRQGQLYLDAIARTKFALDLNKSAGAKNRVVAILWQQGESDAIYDNTNYLKDLYDMVRFMRYDLGDVQLKIPFLMGHPVPIWQETAGAVTKADIVNAINAVANNTPNTHIVTSTGLKSNFEDGVGPQDKIHFSGQSLKALGTRYYNVFTAISP